MSAAEVVQYINYLVVDFFIYLGFFNKISDGSMRKVVFNPHWPSLFAAQDHMHNLELTYYG